MLLLSSGLGETTWLESRRYEVWVHRLCGLELASTIFWLSHWSHSTGAEKHEPPPTISQALISWPLTFMLYNSWSLANLQRLPLTSSYLMHYPSPWVCHIGITLSFGTPNLCHQTLPPDSGKLPTISKAVCLVLWSKCSCWLVTLGRSICRTCLSSWPRGAVSALPLSPDTEAVWWHLGFLAMSW